MALHTFVNPLENDAAGAVVRARFIAFLKDFEVDLELSGQSQEHSTQHIKEYMMQVDQMKQYDQTTLFVDFSHIQTFDSHLATAIAEDYYRFEPFLRRAVQMVVKDRHPEFASVEGEPKEFFLSFFNMQSKLKVRDLRTKEIGCLTAFSGTVTRSSEVRPELLYGCFRCEECGTLNDHVEQQFKYTEPAACRNPACTNRSKWQLVLEQSKFVDWQRVRVQENADEIPAGSMPRSVDVVLRHGAVERAKAGDRCVFTGCLVVVPDVLQLMKAGTAPRAYSRPALGRAGTAASAVDGVTGLKELGVRDLTYRTAFIACSVQKEGQQGIGGGDLDESGEEAAAELFTVEEREDFHRAVASNPTTFYKRFSKAIAPTISGHDEVKRGILLMMLGGVHKQTEEGIRLRGDINVCVVGDPSTAKSQFLKFAVKFLPRAVYTSGKASSAAGLTASVAKDPDTGEFTIEAGALMLADNGVCCIDEFDKMDPADQVAIHEAMEQQTISITKAGIQATLNARTSILAAANPVFGRYDRSKTLRQNVAISPPIMSRFDLFFVVLDDCNEIADRAISKHLVDLHQVGERAIHSEFHIEWMQRFIRYARTFTPQFSDEAAEMVVQCYKKLRQSDVVGASQSSFRITVRQLESLVRLSEALARLHLSDRITPDFVLEAYRLLQRSIIRVETGEILFDEPSVGGELPGDADAAEAAADDDDDDGGDGGGGRGGGHGDEDDDHDHGRAARGGGGRGSGSRGSGTRPSHGAAGSDDEGGAEERKAAEDGGATATATATATTAAALTAAVKAGKKGKKQMQMKFDEYKKIERMLTTYIRSQETDENGGVLRQGDVVAWYLDQQALSSVQALAESRKLINRVIGRLVQVDNTLVVVENGIIIDPKESTVKEEERLIAVHPDFVLPVESVTDQFDV